MTKIFVSLVVLIALLGITLVFLGDSGAQQPAPTTNVPVLQNYVSEKYGLSFSYSDSYLLTEFEAGGSAMREHQVITLQRKTDLPPPQEGEGPPAIVIDVYQNNLDSLTTEEWIRGSNDSNFKLSREGRLASTTIDAMPALSFRWSGLYEGTTIALAQPHWIYAFSVTYLEPGADIVQDFVQVRDSVRITESAMP